MPEDKPEKQSMTAEQLTETITASVTAGIKEGLSGVLETVDEKLAVLSKSTEAPSETKDDENANEKAVLDAEVKDVDYEKHGRYGTGPGAFGRFARDVYLQSKAVQEGTRPPERLVKWRE